ncbi:MAG TPA: hypothetical protein PKL53_04230 [Methylotenera sp.]|nr:hypothetical protein [Methylotenera sp.]
MSSINSTSRSAAAPIVALVLAVFTSSAVADCVDYSETRARQAAKALAKDPPKFSDMGLPELAGLTIDAVRSSGDPKCDPPEKRTYFFYKTNASLLDFYTAIFPYMKPWRTWASPSGRESHNFYVSSGTEVQIRCKGNCKTEDFNIPGRIDEIMINRSNMKDSLTTGGPGWNWTPEDLAKGNAQPAAGRADTERPTLSTTTGSSASGSSNTSSSNNTSNSGSAPKAPDTVDDALNKAKKLKDVLRF